MDVQDSSICPLLHFFFITTMFSTHYSLRNKENYNTKYYNYHSLVVICKLYRISFLEYILITKKKKKKKKPNSLKT